MNAESWPLDRSPRTGPQQDTKMHLPRRDWDQPPQLSIGGNQTPGLKTQACLPPNEWALLERAPGWGAVFIPELLIFLFTTIDSTYWPKTYRLDSVYKTNLCPVSQILMSVRFLVAWWHQHDMSVRVSEMKWLRATCLMLKLDYLTVSNSIFLLLTPFWKTDN